MGTRNLTVVIHDSEVKVAQYGQYDGYPKGQGNTVYNFCKEHLSDQRKRNRFIKKLNKIEFLNVKSELYENKFNDLTNNPGLTRNTAAEILYHIATTDHDKVYLVNQIEFAADSLYNEWTYVIDLDRNTLEVYTGFVKEPLKECERFKYLEPKSEHGFFPVKLIKSFSLNNLISERMYLLELNIDEI